tara:strand:- start:3919 stop:6228 length:2310 start_codon:yes stop_codon:yes gene_type:complete
MLIEIKDFKGFATKADPNDLGLDFSFNNQNFLLDTPGALVKTEGRGGETAVASARMSSLLYWSPSNLKTDGTAVSPIWIGYDAHNDILRMITSNFSSASDIGTAYGSNKPDSFDLRDHGIDFRMAPDNLNQVPKILQYIGRKFFEGGVTVDNYVFQDATPSHPSDSELQLDAVEEVSVGSASGLALGNASASTSYNYKISPIFDGFQELPLQDSYLNLTLATGLTKAGKITVSFANQTAGTGTEPNKVYGFNPRITSLKLYRETDNSGHYYEIKEIPISTSTSDVNVVADGSVDSTTALKGDDYVYTSTLIDDADMRGNSGIFSMPTVTLGSDYANLRYQWYVLMDNGSGTLDSINNPNNSPAVFQGPLGTTSDNREFTFSSGGPLNDTTFMNFVANGIMTVLTNPSEEDRDHNFNTKTRIARVLYGQPVGGSAAILNSPNTTADIINTVWHDKAIIYNMANSKRFGPGAANGYISVDHSGGEHIVIDSVGKAVKLNNISTFTTGQNIDLLKDYVLTIGASKTNIVIYDIGYSNGSVQPYPDDLILNTRYKYSQMIGDRLFVGNVKLDPNGNSEDHPDWVVYSEPNQPDILPSINYIQIKDQQGGHITGLNRILDNLVVFMTRGVFRLDVSSGDPSLYTLMEADKNLGCIAPKGIVNVKDNLFFCARDNIYQITPDFRFTPITLPIKDIYEGSANLGDSILFYDIKKNRLLCRFGSTKTTYFSYDLEKQSWYRYKFTDSTANSGYSGPDFFTHNDELNVYSITVYDKSE